MIPAVVLPPLRVQNILRSLKIRVQVVWRKFVTNVYLAERKSEVWGKSPRKKNEDEEEEQEHERKKRVLLGPVLTAG